VLDLLKNFFNPILSAFSSSSSASEEKDSNGNTSIFSAIESGNLAEVRKIIQKNLLVLEQIDSDGNTPIFAAIQSGKLEIVNAIIEKDPLVLMQKYKNEFTPIFFAIQSQILKKMTTEVQKKIVEAIIEKNRLVLEQIDSDGNTPIFHAISSGKLEIVEAIIENIQEDSPVLKHRNSMEMTPIFHAIASGNLEAVKALMAKDSGVLNHRDSRGLTPIFFAIHSKSLAEKSLAEMPGVQKKIVEVIINEVPRVLKQEDLSRSTPIFYAITLGNPDIVKKIIEKDLSVLKKTDGNGNTPLSLATLISVGSSGHDNDDKASEVLKVILDQQFKGNIDKASQEVFKEFVSKKMLINGIYSNENAPLNFKGLEKAFDKITPESTFKKIYQDLFENVDKNQPISSKKKEEMYIFQSNLKEHVSFFIFHVKDKNLTSISYCDGWTIDEGRKIEGSTAHINGVTTFKLKTPIGYDNDFAKNFITENTKDKSHNVFSDKFRKKEIIFQGKCIDFSEKTTHSIPTKIQKRGNCAIKSTSLVARFISQQQNPGTMEYGFDQKTKEPTGNGYGKYKKFKDNLAKNTLGSIIETKKDISSKSDPLSEHLKQEIENIMKMVETHSKAKLSKDGQSREGFHKKMNNLSFHAHRNRDETPKASCFSFIASCFSPKTRQP